MIARNVLVICLVISALAVPILADTNVVAGQLPKSGENLITFDNSKNEVDAVVVLKDQKWPVPFAVLIPSGKSQDLKLPTASYQAYITLGKMWDDKTKSFSRNAEYYVITDPIEPGSSGEKHDVKTDPKKTANFIYLKGGTEEWLTYAKTSDSAEWSYTEETIPLYNLQGSGYDFEPVTVEDYYKFTNF